MDAVAFLVSSGANVNKQDKWGITPLYLAVAYNYEDVVKVLLNSKENNNLQVNLQNNLGSTALHVACRYGSMDVVELLLQQNGTDVKAVQEDGWTALHLACQQGQTNIVELLLQQNGTDICAVTKYGSTPLHIASAHGRTEVVDFLLQQNGIDVNKVDEFGDTPLHLAVLNQHYDVVASMLAQDSVKLDIENDDKRTPLLDAVYKTHIGIVHKLITCGANINAVDKDGNNCLHIAAEKEEFHSEKEHIPILDECCKELQLDKDRRLSGIVVRGYLASHGASLYHHNDKKVTPLDCIKNQHLKVKLKKFLQSLCWWCQEKKATVTLHPCRHTVICQNCCSQMTFKQCPICRQHIRSKSGFVCPKSEEKAVQTVAESVVCPKSEEKAVQTVAESVVCPKSEEKAVQTVIESFVCPKSEEKAVQTFAESIESLNLKENRSHSTSKKVAVKQQQVETPKLEEKCLQDVAKLLGANWQQVGRNLGIRNVKLGNIRYDYPYNTEEQGFQMLHTWYTSCDPEMRTFKTLRKALVEAECFEALQCLPSKEK